MVRLQRRKTRCGQKEGLVEPSGRGRKRGETPSCLFFFNTESVAGSKGRKTGIKEGKKKGKATIQGI